MGASVRVATVDWPEVILDLRRKGIQNRKIASYTGVSPQTVSNLLNGATREPCYSVGVKILEMRGKAYG